MLALFKDKVYLRLAENAIWLRMGMVAVDACFSIIVNELKSLHLVWIAMLHHVYHLYLTARLNIPSENAVQFTFP